MGCGSAALCSLGPKKKPNTEVTETLRVLCVEKGDCPNPSIMTGNVGGRLAVPFLQAVGAGVGQALPLHRAGAARSGGAAHARTPASGRPVIDGLGAQLLRSRQSASQAVEPLSRRCDFEVAWHSSAPHVRRYCPNLGRSAGFQPALAPPRWWRYAQIRTVPT